MATSDTIRSSRRKLALIIGNNDYSRPNFKLCGCSNDAKVLSSKLREINFVVVDKYDSTKAQMVSAMEEFCAKIKDGDLVLFYFAGHGYQIDGKNYLIPVDDGGINTNEDVPKNAISAQDTLVELEEKNPSHVTIFILDCCRTSYRPIFGSRDGTNDHAKGLHKMDSPKGTFIQFACAADKPAYEGSETNDHGIFTKHLLKYITTPNEDIVQVFRLITAEVQKETKDKQTPHHYSGLSGSNVYLNETNEPTNENLTKSAADKVLAGLEIKIGAEAGTDLIQIAIKYLKDLVTNIKRVKPDVFTEKTIQHFEEVTNHKKNILVIDNKGPHLIDVGESYVKAHVEVPKPKSIGTHGFDIYIFDKGYVTKYGDGGSTNWKYSGNTELINGDPMRVRFNKNE